MPRQRSWENHGTTVTSDWWIGDLPAGRRNGKKFFPASTCPPTIKPKVSDEKFSVLPDVFSVETPDQQLLIHYWLLSGIWARPLHLVAWLCPVHHYVCSKTIPSHRTTIYADLPSLRATEHPPSIIPLSILVTPLKPDKVLLHKDNQASEIELTCSMNIIQEP